MGKDDSDGDGGGGSLKQGLIPKGFKTTKKY